MFEKLWGMLQELENAQGSKAKTVLLRKFVGDKDFVWMAKNALDQGHAFGIENQIPEYEFYKPSEDTEVVLFIEGLKNKNGVSDAEVSELYHLMCSSQARYNVVLRILRKDLRCGVAAKTINKVSPNLIFKVPYQRCCGAEGIDKISFKYGAILQKKADGQFAYLLPSGDFMTRKGETSLIPGNIIAPFVAQLPGLNDKVLAMELVVVDENNKPLNRAVSNGLINSFYKGKGDPTIAPKIRAFTWLYLTEDEFKQGRGLTPYRYVWDKLTQMIPPINSPILTIPSWYVKSKEEAIKKTLVIIADGEEGTVLKSMSDDFLWVDEDPSYFQVKLKAEYEAEFEIIDAYEGDPNKKYKGLLGGVVIRTSDGKVVSDCGSGFSDNHRKLGVQHWKSKVGNIVTVKFNGLTEPNLDGVRSLNHPRFIEERLDKEKADSVESCLRGII